MNSTFANFAVKTYGQKFLGHMTFQKTFYPDRSVKPKAAVVVVIRRLDLPVLQDQTVWTVQME